MTDTTSDSNGRTAQEVRGYLLAHLNAAMRRPGMYGGETALRLYLDAVAFADAAEQVWQEELKDLQTRVAFSTGVRGAFQDLWGDTHEGSVASVYAEIAHRQGWLRLDRTLTSSEYDEIRHASETWCREDRFLSDVVTAFGPPSVLFGGTNPNYPKTLAYTTDRRDDVLLCFHLWNSFTSPSPSSSCVHAEPILWAFRAGGTLFMDGFTFTPEGTARHSLSGGRTQPEGS
ncbi:hypothetical protein SGFS_003720 [Streptomyces graminofaciens]|uniref:Uncharacterized protein n=1 Tax=Streptomyces graminofaciens TaxID=68212 RepID=A0ABN5V703_9ACTN|nr:hypothetical protein [Streptomyces graminofaciens]BBC29081.1 hypothetical protein SGFS_003720 [Streptomyces graminofaciens]